MSFTVSRPRTRTSTPRPLGDAPRDGVRTTLHLKSEPAPQASGSQSTDLAAEAAAFRAKRRSA
jgi:hypothetical protein